MKYLTGCAEMFRIGYIDRQPTGHGAGGREKTCWRRWSTTRTISVERSSSATAANARWAAKSRLGGPGRRRVVRTAARGARSGHGAGGREKTCWRRWSTTRTISVERSSSATAANRPAGTDATWLEWISNVMPASYALEALPTGGCASAFARTEFQAVQFIPAGDGAAAAARRHHRPAGTDATWLEWISNVMPASYALEALPTGGCATARLTWEPPAPLAPRVTGPNCSPLAGTGAGGATTSRGLPVDRRNRRAGRVDCD